MQAHPGAPYDQRVPPGPRGRRRPARWSRPDGSLPQRLARARLVILLGRAGSVGDWIALSAAAVAVAAILAAAQSPPAAGRIRAPHLAIDYALCAVEPGPAGGPARAQVHGAGPGLARTLAAGDLVAVETATDAGWYRVERVEVTACGSRPSSEPGLSLATECRGGLGERAVIHARPAPVVPGRTWI